MVVVEIHKPGRQKCEMAGKQPKSESRYPNTRNGAENGSGPCLPRNINPMLERRTL